MNVIAITTILAQKPSTIILTSNKAIPQGFYLNVQDQDYGFNPEKESHELSITVEGPEYGFLVSPKGKTYMFWYEEGEVKLNFQQSLMKDELLVDGSTSHIIYKSLDEASKFSDFKSVFHENNQSAVALNYIESKYKFLDFSANEFQEIHELIASDSRDLTPRFNAYIEVMDKEKLEKNSQFIDFVGFDKDGKAFNSADFRGKYLLIDVAATWCRPCWTAFPYMIKSLNEYQNIQFLTLNEDNRTERWLAMASERKLDITWPVLWEVETGKEKLLHQYKIDSFPTYILVDPDGKVVERWSFSSEKVFSLKLKKYLKKM
ncbi:TlpA disulfide reductase family protein [uncultured Marivirga sp.]|uniref:TlpA family protein disulfide reductase n=1 Tax=uncultured Marivirga sp. TaxID=1123707 RepID=UPI0030EF029A